MSVHRLELTVAAALSFAIAAFHLVIMRVGAPAYRYFGAGEEMARRAESGSALPPLLTLFATAVFAVFGLLALAGAGHVRSLIRGFVRSGLVVVTAIYLLRGLAVVPEVIALLRGSPAVLPRQAVFSLISLLVGGIYARGTFRYWARLGK